MQACVEVSCSPICHTERYVFFPKNHFFPFFSLFFSRKKLGKSMLFSQFFPIFFPFFSQFLLCSHGRCEHIVFPKSPSARSCGRKIIINNNYFSGKKIGKKWLKIGKKLGKKREKNGKKVGKSENWEK